MKYTFYIEFTTPAGAESAASGISEKEDIVKLIHDLEEGGADVTKVVSNYDWHLA